MEDRYPRLPVGDDLGYLKKNGVLIIDKPSGPTSHQVSAWARDLVGADKAGHGGTLDPKVTGVLPVAFGPSARAVHYLHLAPKEYVGLLRLHHTVENERILSAFRDFTGPIYQLPPVRAAVKRERRVRRIYELELLEHRDDHVLFRTRCESGTYIRTLCHDIGEMLGVGGHMVELRRTATGHFREENAVTLQEVSDFLYFAEQGDGKDSPFLPMESLFLHLPRVIIKDNAVETVRRGAQLNVPGMDVVEGDFRKGDRVLLAGRDSRAVAVGIAKASSDVLRDLSRGEAVKLETVFNTPDR